MVTTAGRRTPPLLAGLGVALAARGALRRARRADLRDRVAVVTGASRGLGFLLARTLAGHGCRLVLCARDGAELERARADLAHDGAQVLGVPCDVADRAQAERLVEQATARFGQVDLLVNNAGVIQVGPLATITTEDFEEALGVMLWGVLHPTLAVLPQMLERRAGQIVNITSIGAKISVPHLLPYSTAKFAAAGLSEGLRAELAGSGVGVTTVVPGLMRTGSHLNAWFKGRDAAAEFTWFSLCASLPLLSMDAERAARRIVEAARRDQAELILTPQARLAAGAHGLFPGTVTRALSIMDRLLPAAGGTDRSRGMELMAQRRSPLLRGATHLGMVAARRFHQFPGPTGLPQDPGAAAGEQRWVSR